MTAPPAFVAWCGRIAREDAEAAAAIRAMLAPVARIRAIAAKRKAEHDAAVAADRDSPWWPGFDHVEKAAAEAEEAIYALSEAFAENFSADMPEPDA